MNGAAHAITYLLKYTFMRRLKKTKKYIDKKIYIFTWFAITTPYKKCKNLFKYVYFCLRSARQQCPHNGLILEISIQKNRNTAFFSEKASAGTKDVHLPVLPYKKTCDKEFYERRRQSRSGRTGER